MASDMDMRGFVPEPSGRGTIGILISCISTIFICVWTSLHPSIPLPSDIAPAYSTVPPFILDKFKLAITMLLVPEVMISAAVAEYLEVRWIVEDVNARYPSCSWTLTDAYFVSMNGYVYDKKALSHTRILALVREGYIDPIKSDSCAIHDRSKADTLAKIIACVQISWLMIQCLARAITHLPISTLELGVIGNASMAIIVYGIQWHKPKDIRNPTFLQQKNGQSTAVVIEASRSAYSLLGDDCTESTNGERIVHDSRGGDHHEGGEDRNTDRAMSFWRAVFERNRLVAYTALAITCLVFGGWHCLAWNFTFPSVAELWIWRVCSVACIIPGLVFVILYVVWIDATLDHISVLMFVLSGISMISRGTILVLMFIGLRRLPAGVFETVQWTTILPHF
ncbi:hypothetical protein DENSPDRAFT_839988 [Dentipellis sp. KUC8613]|nr:hypothetical protein DENSPDRAFT_839988 [Dentipellis sp. KUC8613]